MNRELILKHIKSMNLVEQLDISIEILENVISHANPSEKLILNELNEVKNILKGELNDAGSNN